MSIFDQIEKLITEHGSSTILRERLALAKDQFAVLEKEIVNLRSDNAILISKVENLQTKDQSLTKENQELKSIIQQYEHPDENIIDDIKVNILLFLSKQHNNALPEDVARSLNINIQVANFHIQELENSHMISRFQIIGMPSRWCLAHEGRRYLIEHKLIS